ncbi:PucR family transcriptional regulator [Rhodococcus sp. NPDC003322]
MRLSELPPTPESALAVVRYFDRLDHSAASEAELIDAACDLAEGTVAVTWLNGEPAIRVEREGSPHPLETILIDRLTWALQRQCERARNDRQGQIDDPALAEIVLSDKESPQARARALRLLGLDTERPLQVLALSTRPGSSSARVVVDALGGAAHRRIRIGQLTALLYHPTDEVRQLAERMEAAIAQAFPAPFAPNADPGPWVGIGSLGDALNAPTSWQQAVRCLQFTSSTTQGRRVVAYERLHIFELLAEIPVDTIRRNPTLLRIEELAATPSGAQAVATTEAFFVFGSLRRTAAELHVHHSTVAARLATISEYMDWDLDDPIDRFTAMLALTVRRMALSSSGAV